MAEILLKPIVTEKMTRLTDEGRHYAFQVAKDANKIQIRQAIESIFDVKVLKVTTANRKGKRKRNRRALTFGRRPDTKRAIVTLVGDDRIDLFES